MPHIADDVRIRQRDQMETRVKALLSCGTALKAAAGGRCSGSHASTEASGSCESKIINTS